MSKFKQYLETVQRTPEKGDEQVGWNLVASFDSPNSANEITKKIIEIASNKTKKEEYEQTFGIKIENVPSVTLPPKGLSGLSVTKDQIGWVKNVLENTLDGIKAKHGKPKEGEENPAPALLKPFFLYVPANGRYDVFKSFQGNQLAY